MKSNVYNVVGEIRNIVGHWDDRGQDHRLCSQHMHSILNILKEEGLL